MSGYEREWWTSDERFQSRPPTPAPKRRDYTASYDAEFFAAVVVSLPILIIGVWVLS